MASRTAITENRRKAKHRAAGAKRKAANRNKGTTPKFAIHEDGAPKATKAAAPKVATPKAAKAPKAAAAKAPKAAKATK